MDDLTDKGPNPPKPGEPTTPLTTTATLPPVTETSGGRQGPPTITAVGSSMNEDPDRVNNNRPLEESDKQKAVDEAQKIVNEAKDKTNPF